MPDKMVPVLITWDVDPDRWAGLERRRRALSMTLDLCEDFGIQSTFYIVANYAHEYPDHLDRMQALGQEIGCHGLTHAEEEDYDRMPADMQRVYIREATDKLQALTDTRMLSFRGPRVKISGGTLRVLAEHGYRADSSVCSQRIDFISSNLINPGWIVAPRRPYRPHHTSAYKRGDTPVWEIPVSAMVLPFISGSLNVFGLRFMKFFFKLLYAESRRTGKPIVYLSHPAEFVTARIRVSLRELYPAHIRTHGLMARRALYRMDGTTWYTATRELFAYMAAFPGVSFMTSSEYVDFLENGTKP